MVEAQLERLFEGLYLMESSKSLKKDYNISKTELDEMINLCHCQMFGVNLKSMIINMKNYFECNKELPHYFSTIFNSTIEYIFETFFKKLNYNKETFFLHKDSHNQSNQALPFLEYNQYLYSILERYRESQVTQKSDYFLLVESLVAIERRNERNQKRSFSDAGEILGLIYQIIENKEEYKSLWLKFKNYYPITKGKVKKEAEEASYEMIPLIHKIKQFSTDSSSVFEGICSKTSKNNESNMEVNIIEAVNSLISAFVVYYTYQES